MIHTVAAQIRKHRIFFSGESDRPVLSFFFAGPTGVGKTETAKAIAVEVFGDEKRLIRIDMSEYMEHHTVQRLVGAPPSYAGYEEGGQLTNSLDRQPYSTVLFDEVEKAHPRVLDVLLQLLSDGRLTDGKGKVVSARDAVFIFTSNLPIQGSDPDAARKQLARFLRPEIVGRMTTVAVFQPIRREDFATIIRRRVVQPLAESMARRFHFQLRVANSVYDHLVESFTTPEFGARELVRRAQDELQNALAEVVLRAPPPGGVLELAWDSPGRVYRTRLVDPKVGGRE